MSETKALRADLARLQRGRGVRYSAAMRQRITQVALDLRAAGRGFQSIGRELGIPHETIRRFCSVRIVESPAPVRESAFRPVAVRLDPPQVALVLGDLRRTPGRGRVGRRRRRDSARPAMIALPRRIRVWAYGQPADLHKGYNGLCGIVKKELGRDVLDGDLFLFVNRRRSGCKVLLWDGTGLCIFAKRLERGRFAELWRDDGAVVRLTSSELALFIEGCTLVGKRSLSPAEVLRNDLAVAAPV